MLYTSEEINKIINDKPWFLDDYEYQDFQYKHTPYGSNNPLANNPEAAQTPNMILRDKETNLLVAAWDPDWTLEKPCPKWWRLNRELLFAELLKRLIKGRNETCT